MGDARKKTGGWLSLTAFVLGCEAVGAVSGWLTAADVSGWYQNLAKPAFNPPDAVFGPVWTMLYALMGIAAWLVWRSPQSKQRQRGFFCFGGQLILNFLWTLYFFHYRALLLAAVEILLLLLLIVATTVLFGRVRRAAAWLMLPYALWVGFAAILSWSIWRLN